MTTPNPLNVGTGSPAAPVAVSTAAASASTGTITNAAPGTSGGVNTAIVAHPAADPSHPNHLQFVLSLIDGLFASTTPTLLKLVPSKGVQLGVGIAGVGIAAVETALELSGVIPMPAQN